MPQFVTTATQTVAVGQNVRFTATPVRCTRGFVQHREGSGMATLQGPVNGQCRARYKVTFNGNIAIADGGTVEPVSVALAVNGEPLYSATAIATPAAIGDFFNVCVNTYIDVQRGTPVNISVENTSGTTAIDVSNASLIITREA